MGIKRGSWQPMAINKTATVSSGSKFKPANVQSTDKSRSETIISQAASNQEEQLGRAYGSVSDFRKGELDQTNNFHTDKNGSARPLVVYSNSYKKAQEIKKIAGSSSVIGGQSFGIGGDTVRLGPEVYSPLFQMANLQLPRDRVTMNAWNRNFYDTHPLVRNCINLHSTYPLGKMNIRCKDKKVEQFFYDMMEEIDLLGIVQDIACEFWKIGEKIQGSSLVTMSDGTLKPISEIEIGDIVLTHLGNKKRVVEKFAKPTNTVIEDDLNIYKIHIEGLHEPLIISGRHPMLSLDGNKVLCKRDNCKNIGQRVLPTIEKCSKCRGKSDHKEILPDFVDTNNVKCGDLVYAPFNTDEQNIDGITENFCYILGYWLAEGCYCKVIRNGERNFYDGIKFCSYDKDYLDKFIPIFENEIGKGKLYVSDSSDRFNQTGQTKNKYDCWYQGLYKNGHKAANFFKQHCGEFSKEKSLSEQMMNLPPHLQSYILAGFADGDGCTDLSNNRMLLCTSSKNLANQFVLILRRLGAEPTISKQMSKINGKNTGNYNYRISISANASKEIFDGKIKSNRHHLKETKWTATHSVIQDNWQVLKIKKIENITKEFKENLMYDIEVEDDHSYIANGIAIHNCFPYAELDASKGTWKSISIQNPDYMHVKKSMIGGEPIISLQPDAALRRLVTSNNPADVQLRKQISPEIIHHVRKGNNIPLDNFHISHLKMAAAPYDIHGTSIIVSIYKDLMLYDKLRESKFAQADNLVNPITLVSVGGNTDGEYRATEEDLEAWRQTIEAAQYDKDFKIISHAGVKIERVGASGSIIDISGDMNFIIDNILYGLMVPKAILTQEGASYGSASIGLEVLKQRYESFRNMIAKWLTLKIFAPISEIHDFAEYKDGVRKLIVPEIDWNQMILFDMDNYINVLNNLHQKGQDGMRSVSKHTLFRSLGLDPQEEQRRIREEMIQEEILTKENAIIKGMTLSSLRAIKDGDDIIEPTDEPLPGMPGAEDSGVPGTGGGGGMGLGGGDMGLPPLPGGGGLGGGLDLGGGDMGMGDLGGGGGPAPTGEPGAGEI